MIAENVALKEDPPLFPKGSQSQSVQRTKEKNEQTNFPCVQEISLQHPERFLAFMVIGICILSAFAAFIR